MKNNEFGKNFKTLRLQLGLSQKEIGEKLGFCNQTISFWESGAREPDLDTIKEIAKFYDVSVDSLIE